MKIQANTSLHLSWLSHYNLDNLKGKGEVFWSRNTFLGPLDVNENADPWFALRSAKLVLVNGYWCASNYHDSLRFHCNYVLASLHFW